MDSSLGILPGPEIYILRHLVYNVAIIHGE